MKKFLFKIFFIALIAGAAWVAISTYHKIDEGRFGYVEEIDSGLVLKIFTDEHNFIWQGAFPNLYRVQTTTGRFSVSHDVILGIPPITDLEDERYAIKIPVYLRFRVAPEEIYDLQLFYDSGEKIKEFTISEIKRIYNNIYGEYLSDEYRREELIEMTETNKELVKNEITERLETEGFRIIDFTQDRISFPSYAVYNEGVSYQEEYRAVQMRAKRDMVQLKSRLERKQAEDASRFDYLGRISDMISDNPDLLKYIYIDRIGPDVKVVISSDKELVPELFRPEPEKSKADKKEESDDLD